jgi:hypothetical protein
LIRMLPPLPAMKESEVDLAVDRIEAALLAVREEIAGAKA